MEARLHQYQEYAKQRIIEQEAAGLFLDMGLGKTLTTLTAIDELMYDRFEVSRVLVIAPLRVAQTTWTDEIRKWDNLGHLRTVRILGSAAQRIRALQQDADVYIINRENTQWLIEQFGRYLDQKHKKGFELLRWPFDMVVIDELSSFKSPSSQRFKFLRKALPWIERIVGLTGTPRPNGLLDLWAQVFLLDQGQRLGNTVTAYKDRFFKPGKRDPNRGIVFEWLPREGSEEAIYKSLADLCISMKASDWLKMPERIDMEIKLEMDEETRKQYFRLEHDLIIKTEEKVITAGTAGAVTGKLQQFAQGAIYTDDKTGWARVHDIKLDALEDLVEAANGQPLLVYYWYKHDLERILQRIPTARELKTADDVHAWNRGEIPIMLAHPASAGHGLNLQSGGHTIIWFSLTWSLEAYQQANARLQRQGQTSESVIIYHLIATGTIDEDILAVLAGKAEGQDAMMEAVKARINKYRKEEKIA